MKNQKGFTLSELLIVMAIIVVLAAIAVPTFGKQLETSRETNDMSIIRNAYTEAFTYASQDGSDGLFNNKVGETSFSASGITLTPSQTTNANDTATVEVTIATVIQSGKFSQNGTVENGAASSEWNHVSNSFMGLTVPPVCTPVTKLTFKFQFNTTGEVVPVKAAGDNDLFTIATT